MFLFLFFIYFQESIKHLLDLLSLLNMYEINRIHKKDYIPTVSFLTRANCSITETERVQTTQGMPPPTGAFNGSCLINLLMYFKSNALVICN